MLHRQQYSSIVARIIKQEAENAFAPERGSAIKRLVVKHAKQSNGIKNEQAVTACESQMIELLSSLD